MVDALLTDVKYAARSLAARPGYAGVHVVTIGLVLGAATAVLAVVNATMIRPLPYPAADRLVRLYLQPPGTTGVQQRNPLSPRAFERFRTGGLPLVEAMGGFQTRDRALGGEGEPESVPGALATAGALPLLGSPIIGRFWTEDDDRANARVVVLAHSLWQRRFGGDPSMLGRTIVIDREPHEVIGVMPRGFQAIFLDAELWTPLHFTEAAIQSSTTFVQTVARLRQGATVDQLRASIGPAMSAVVAESTATLTGWGAGAAGLLEWQFAAERPALMVLVAAVAALMLLAAANLVNVTLAHVMSRRAETALRLALGASAGRVVRFQIVEGLILGALGGLAGLLLGTITLPVLLVLDPQTARLLGDVQIDGRVQVATLGLAIVVALVAGVAPVLRELSSDAARGIVDGNRRVGGSRRDDRVRRVLVAAETALAAVLLAAGAVLLSGFQQTARSDPGFDPAGVIGGQLRLPQAAYPTDVARTAVVTRILDRVRAVPGVESAGTTLNLFRPGFAFQTLVHIEGRPTPDGQPHTVHFRRASPDYFKTMRIPVLKGRDFGPSDGADAPAVAIVSRTFADRFWPGEDPLGRALRRTSGRPLTVVGVVGDVSDVGLGQVVEPTLYVALMQNNPVIANVSLVVRGRGDTAALSSAVRAAVLSVDRDQPVDHLTTLDEFLAESLGTQRFRSTLLLVLAALGLAIASVGIYGVTARAVQERAREVGVRLALGARPGAVWRLVVGQALAAVAVGLAIGIAAAVAANAAILRAVPGLESAEWWLAIPAILALVIAAIAAAALPAARAVRVDPTGALRD